MSRFRIFAAMSTLVLFTGCAAMPATESGPPPVRLDELVALSKQGLVDDALVSQLAQRGVAFVLSPQDTTALREAGVSNGVLRYLQGRADGDRALAARIQRGRYPASAYYGTVYLGYPYLGYAYGLHYYGGTGYHFLGAGGHGGYGWQGGHGWQRGHGWQGGHGQQGGHPGGHGRSHSGGSH